jgi:hypothetical protein
MGATARGALILADSRARQCPPERARGVPRGQARCLRGQDLHGFGCGTEREVGTSQFQNTSTRVRVIAGQSGGEIKPHGNTGLRSDCTTTDRIKGGHIDGKKARSGVGIFGPRVSMLVERFAKTGAQVPACVEAPTSRTRTLRKKDITLQGVRAQGASLFGILNETEQELDFSINCGDAVLSNADQRSSSLRHLRPNCAPVLGRPSSSRRMKSCHSYSLTSYLPAGSA